MNDLKILLTVFILAAGVMLTRFLPFAVFKDANKLPGIITYLGKVLPPAMMGFLVIYCMKDYNLLSLSEVLPLFAAVTVVVTAQLVKHNSVLSIFAGTAVYMILIRIIA